MLMLILSLFSLSLQSPPGEFRHWKPGPAVRTELERLDLEASKLLTRTTQERVSRDYLSPEKFAPLFARLQARRHFLKLHAWQSQRDEVPRLVIARVGVSGDYLPAFPRGDAPPLEAGQTYESEPGSKLRWRYLGRRCEGGRCFDGLAAARE